MHLARDRVQQRPYINTNIFNYLMERVIEIYEGVNYKYTVRCMRLV